MTYPNVSGSQERLKEHEGAKLDVCKKAHCYKYCYTQDMYIILMCAHVMYLYTAQMSGDMRRHVARHLLFVVGHLA